MSDNNLPPTLDPPEAEGEPELPPLPPPPIQSKYRLTRSEFTSKIGSLFSGLFVLYLIVSGNFVGELFSCDLQQIMTENYLVKHLLGFATLFFFVNMVSSDIHWPKPIIAGISLAMYLLFIISNRSSATTQLINIGLLFAIFVMHMVATDMKDDEDQEMKKRITTAQWAVAIGIVVLTLYGHILYIGKKRIEFRGQFSYFKLFKGTVCRNQDEREYGWGESLQAVFGVFRDPPPAKITEKLLPQSPAYLDTASFFDNGSGMSSEYSQGE